MHFKGIIFCANYKTENIRIQLQRQKHCKIWPPQEWIHHYWCIIYKNWSTNLLFFPALRNTTKKSFY